MATASGTWTPPPPQNHHQVSPEEQHRIDVLEGNSDGSSSLKKFTFGMFAVLLVFAIIWWLWMMMCSGSQDEDPSDEGSFCELLDGAANVMNDFASGVTYVTTHLLAVAALAVTLLAITITCKISGKCVDGLIAAKEFLYEFVTGKGKGENPDVTPGKNSEDPDRKNENPNGDDDQEMEDFSNGGAGFDVA